MLFHPYEWVRAFRLFLSTVDKDLELRFPETRKRFAIQMKKSLPPEDFAHYQNIIRRFQSAKRPVSAFDWPLLVEWNERKEQALCVALIREHLQLKAKPISQNIHLIHKIHDRLNEIVDQILSLNLPKDPRLWTSLKARWQSMFLIDEAQYLCSRLQKLCSG